MKINWIHIHQKPSKINFVQKLLTYFTVRLDINCNKPYTESIRKAIKFLKDGIAAGSDGIPAETIRVNTTTLNKLPVLHALFSTVQVTEEPPVKLKRRIFGNLVKQRRPARVRTLQRNNVIVELLEKCLAGLFWRH